MERILFDFKPERRVSSLTFENLSQMRAMLSNGDRAGPYLYYYQLTGSKQALMQAAITTGSGVVGGSAVQGNYFAKRDHPEIYEKTGDLDHKSHQIVEGFLDAVESNLKRGGNGILSDTTIRQADHAVWESWGLGDSFPGNLYFDGNGFSTGSAYGAYAAFTGHNLGKRPLEYVDPARFQWFENDQLVVVRDLKNANHIEVVWPKESAFNGWGIGLMDETPIDPKSTLFAERTAKWDYLGFNKPEGSTYVPGHPPPDTHYLVDRWALDAWNSGRSDIQAIVNSPPIVNRVDHFNVTVSSGADQGLLSTGGGYSPASEAGLPRGAMTDLHVVSDARVNFSSTIDVSPMTADHSPVLVEAGDSSLRVNVQASVDRMHSLAQAWRAAGDDRWFFADTYSGITQSILNHPEAFQSPHEMYKVTEEFANRFFDGVAHPENYPHWQWAFNECQSVSEVGRVSLLPDTEVCSLYMAKAHIEGDLAHALASNNCQLSQFDFDQMGKMVQSNFDSHLANYWDSQLMGGAEKMIYSESMVGDAAREYVARLRENALNSAQTLCSQHLAPEASDHLDPGKSAESFFQSHGSQDVAITSDHLNVAAEPTGFATTVGSGTPSPSDNLSFRVEPSSSPDFGYRAGTDFNSTFRPEVVSPATANTVADVNSFVDGHVSTLAEPVSSPIESAGSLEPQAVISEDLGEPVKASSFAKGEYNSDTSAAINEGVSTTVEPPNPAGEADNSNLATNHNLYAPEEPVPTGQVTSAEPAPAISDNPYVPDGPVGTAGQVNGPEPAPAISDNPYVPDEPVGMAGQVNSPEPARAVSDNPYVPDKPVGAASQVNSPEPAPAISDNPYVPDAPVGAASQVDSPEPAPAISDNPYVPDAPVGAASGVGSPEPAPAISDNPYVPDEPVGAATGVGSPEPAPAISDNPYVPDEPVGAATGVGSPEPASAISDNPYVPDEPVGAATGVGSPEPAPAISDNPYVPDQPVGSIEVETLTEPTDSIASSVATDLSPDVVEPPEPDAVAQEAVDIGEGAADAVGSVVGAFL